MLRIVWLINKITIFRTIVICLEQFWLLDYFMVGVYVV